MIYLDQRRVEVIAADFTDSGIRATVTYHESEFNEDTTAYEHNSALSKRHREPLEVPMSHLRADEGLDEVYEAIRALDDEQVDGKADWLDGHLRPTE